MPPTTFRLDLGEGRVVERRQPRLRRGERSGGIIPLGARPLEAQNVVGDEGRQIEAQRQPLRRRRKGEVGARPVDHRHEVVANGSDAGADEADQTILPGVDIAPPRALAQLDRRGDRDRFADIPGQAGVLDGALARRHVFGAPGATVIDVVERGDDSHRAGLPGVVQGDRIVGAEPAPGFTHDPASGRACVQAMAATIAPTITEMTMPQTTTAAV